MQQKSSHRRSYVPLVLFIMALATAVPLGWGQGGLGSIAGTVADSSGALVPDVKVTITNTGTGRVREVQTAQDGTYAVPLLPPGNYTVTVSKTGFNTVTRSGIVVAPDQVASVDISMAVGTVATTVEVAANAEMITTTDATIGQLINSTTVTELPLNGRNPASLVFLAPGSTNGLNTSGAYLESWCCGFDTQTTASIGGSRMGAVYYLLNGANNEEAWQTAASPFPNADATAEFQVLTNNFGAQYGFASGGVVSIVTKSGTNQWHGNAFEFLRNSDLNAKSYYGHQADPLKRNQFGGSIGGKIIRDKLFVFGNYQATINNTTSFSNTTYVPSDAMLNGDFSALLPGIQLYDQNGNPYSNNYIDPSTFNPVSLKIEAGLPKTSDPLGFTTLPGVVQNDHYQEFTIKTDFYASTKDHFAFTDFVDKYVRPPHNGGGDLLLSLVSRDFLYNFHSLNWTRSFSPTLINNFIFGYARTGTTSYADMVGPDGKPACLPCYGMNITDFNQWPTDIDGLSVSGGPFIFGNDNLVPRNNMSFDDMVTWTKGKQLVVAGVDILRMDMHEETDYLARPNTSFTGQYTGFGMADFLTGRLQSITQAGGELGEAIGVSYGFYAGDTIRLKPNLSVNVGLRWEPWFPPTVLGGRMTDFRPGQQSTRFPNAPLGEVFPGDTGIGPGGYPNEVANFLPRLGMAWQPKALPNTSIRAAYGLFMQNADYSGYAHTWDGSPFSPEYVPTGGPGHGQFLNFTDPFAGFAPTDGLFPYPAPFPWAPAVPPKDVAFLPPFSLLDTFSPTYKMGKVNSWNVSIEHQFTPNMLLRVAYVGSEAYHLPNPTDANPGYYSAGGARLRFPNYAEILQNEADSTASYNSLQLTFEKRFSRGLQYTSNFTYSKNIDSNSWNSTAWVGSVGDPFDLSWNRGISDLNLPYIFSNQGVYRLPSLSQYGRFVNGVLGAWEISGLFQLQAGPPLNIVGGYGNNNSEALEYGDRADLTGQPYREHQGSKSHWLQQYFNPAAFRQNAPGTFGNAPRNVFRAPRLNNVDMAIVKNFPFKERYSAQFRWEMFNAFNYVQFGGPINDPSNPSFGQITGQANANRVMQAALKLYF